MLLRRFDQPKRKKNGIFSQAEWNESMEQVYSFDTVEDFWCLFNNLLPVSNLENGASYNLFKVSRRLELGFDLFLSEKVEENSGK